MAVDAKNSNRTPLVDDYHLLNYQSLDSTNEEAKRLAHGGGKHGAFIWAHKQTDGRGRRGRGWVSNSGNLFVSSLLSPNCALKILPQLSFVAAVAIHASIVPLLPDAEFVLKWPNDLLLDNDKLAGLLLESFEIIDEETGEQKRWAVIGLGLNIENCPNDTQIPATCLKDAGVELISAKIVLARFIHNFIEWYELWQNDGFAPIAKYWMKHCAHKGKVIEVVLGDDTHKGMFEGLDDDGNLLLKKDDGKVITISAGEVLL